MQELKARLAAIVDSSLDAVIGVDESGVITTWNRGAEVIYGYSSAEALGKTLAITSPEAGVAWSPDIQAKLSRERSLKQYETVRCRKDGTEVHVSITASPIITGDGRNIGTSFIDRDITDRIRRDRELLLAIDQAQAAARAKGEFVANISHELRTPMNAIIGMLELSLRSEQLPSIIFDYLETARDSAQLLLALVNDLLDFSRLEAGKFELDEQDFSLKKVVDDSLRVLAMRAGDQGLELVYRIDEDVPDQLRGDPRRFRQILLNLIGNSIKFTEEGEVVVRIRPLKIDQERVQLQISIRDTGIGIPEEHLDTIFQPFTQLDNSSTRKYSGAGLGLTICREFIEQMGGKILVESRLGSGTTVHITPQFAISTIEKNVNADDCLEDIRNRRVLIVDDNATNRLILEETLKYRDVETVSVASGAAALRTLSESVLEGRPFDLVLIDALMPEMDGISLIRQIRKDDSLPDPAVLMLSSADRLRLEKECEILGVSACLEKPISESALLEAMRSALAQIKSSTMRSFVPLRTTGRSLRILVAEDTVANQKVVRSILETRGHQVVIAPNGIEAVREFGKQPFDIVLMDVQMPTLDGLQATRLIRENPQSEETPIIALTAHAMKGDRIRCLQAGMDGYLSKPFEADELIRLVETTRRIADQIHGDRNQFLEIKNGDSMEQHQVDSQPISVQIVDLKLALERLAGDAELLKQLSVMYLEDVPNLLKELRQAFERGDSGEVTRLSHSICGLSATFGAQKCCSVARAMEDCGRRDDLVEAKKQLVSLQDECELVYGALRSA